MSWFFLGTWLGHIFGLFLFLVSIIPQARANPTTVITMNQNNYLHAVFVGEGTGYWLTVDA